MMRFATFLVLSFSILQSPLSRADDEGTKRMPELNKEERAKRADVMDKIAELHTKMAECLRTDKPTAECREQMRKDCPMSKEGHCPMMDEMDEMHGMNGMHHRRRGKGRMMKKSGSEPETKK